MVAIVAATGNPARSNFLIPAAPGPGSTGRSCLRVSGFCFVTLRHPFVYRRKPAVMLVSSIRLVVQGMFMGLLRISPR